MIQISCEFDKTASVNKGPYLFLVGLSHCLAHAKDLTAFHFMSVLHLLVTMTSLRYINVSLLYMLVYCTCLLYMFDVSLLYNVSVQVHLPILNVLYFIQII